MNKTNVSTKYVCEAPPYGDCYWLKMTYYCNGNNTPPHPCPPPHSPPRSLSTSDLNHHFAAKYVNPENRLGIANCPTTKPDKRRVVWFTSSPGTGPITQSIHSKCISYVSINCPNPSPHITSETGLTATGRVGHLTQCEEQMCALRARGGILESPVSNFKIGSGRSSGTRGCQGNAGGFHLARIIKNGSVGGIDALFKR